MHNFAITVRSLLFHPPYVVVVVVFSLLTCTVGRLMSVPLRQQLATIGNWLILKLLWLICGVRYQVTGRENLPTDTPSVILSNHQSGWETYFLQREMRPVSTILKRELLRIPVFGWGLAAVWPIAIDRGNPRQALREVLEQGQQRLAAGLNVVVYPEGTRMPYGETGKYGRSGAALAIAAGVPVVPIAHNAGRCWPAKQWRKYPGTISVVIGKPISPEGHDSKSLMQLAEQWIKDTQKSL